MTDWPDGYGRFVLAEVDSTLDEALRMAVVTPGRFWLLAHRQTKARGRRGRPWRMAPGNFAATLIMQPEESPGVAALRSFVVSLALWRAFVEVSGMPQVFALKWPNDILLNGGKVAGILLESSGAGGRMGPLAIGVGVNLVAAPAQAEVEVGAVPPVSLAGETGLHIGPEAFLAVLARHYAALEAQFCLHGFAPIRRAWLDAAARRGEVITARTARGETVGVFENVDDAGNLILRDARGRHAIAAADVFF
jgi:BirA family biotin operon repressor/biotin-[acetyl-CoA-carboxylase] ligase